MTFFFPELADRKEYNRHTEPGVKNETILFAEVRVSFLHVQPETASDKLFMKVPPDQAHSSVKGQDLCHFYD